MESKTSSFSQEYELATQHLAALRRQLDRLPDRQDATLPALDELAQSLLALRKAHGDISRQNEEGAARCQGLGGQLAYYRDLFEHAPHARLLTDLSGAIQAANAPASILLQAPRDELNGQRLADFLPEQEREALSGHLARLQAGEALLGWEVYLHLPSGEAVPVSLDAVPIHGLEQQLVGLQWLVRDLSRQVQAEAALHRNENMYRLLVESLHDGIWLIDKDAYTTFANPRMADMLGYTVDEMIGAHLFSFVDEKDLDLARARMDRRRKGIRENVDFEFRRKDGTLLSANIEVTPLFDAGGQYAGAVAGIADMTERRRYQQERERLLAQALDDRQRIEAISAQARRQADELAAILNAIPDPVGVWDVQGNVLRANPAAAALGIVADERGMVGVAERLSVRHPDGRPILPEELPVARALRGEVIRDEAEFLVNPAGEEQEILVSVAPVVSGGEIVACVVVSHDITDLRRTEAAMRESEEKLGTLFELLPVGISVMDGERRISQTNAALLHILDLPREALAQGIHRARTYLRSDGTVMPPDEFPSARAWREQRPVHDQVGIVKEDGTVIWTDVSAAPVPFADWKLVVVTVDVTERKQVEETLQEERDRLAALVNSVRDEIWFADPSGQFTLVNPSGSREFDLETNAAPDVRQFAASLEVFHPDGTPRPIEEAPPLRALRGEVVTDQQEMVRRPATGELRHRQVSAAPVRDGSGNIIGSVSVVHDITVQKQAEEAMLASRQMLETVVNCMPAAVTLLRGSDLRLQFVNPAYQAIAPGKEMVGKTLDELWPETGQSFAAICRHVLETGEPYQVVDELNTIRRRPDGPLEPAYFTWSLHRVRLPGDEGWGLLDTAWETTGRKQIEQALRQARDELERRVQERTAELERANLMLLAEIRERTRVEGELRQSEQQLEQRVDERTRELATLLDISNTVALSIDLEPLLALILERLKDVVDYDGGAAYRLEDAALNPVFHRGAIPAEDLLQIGSHLEEAVLGQAALPGVERVIVADVQSEPALREAFRQATGARFEAMAQVVRAWITVPVTIKQRVYGVLYMYHSQPGRYSEEQARMALPFGNQAAVAIENARLYEQAQRLAALEERQHLARELHDAVTQTLFSASLAAEVLPRLWERDREAGLRCLTEVHQLTRGALAEMRTLLLELRPSTLVETNLGALLQQLAEATGSRARITVTVQAELHCSLEPEVQVALYRISQEALNNAAKHAGARHVEVRLECEGPCSAAEELTPTTTVELFVADDGRGFDPGHLPAGCKGLGLGIMRERAEAIGAALQIESEAGHGTRITVRWSGDD
jgi:PAS domain S-box-containing protein